MLSALKRATLPKEESVKDCHPHFDEKSADSTVFALCELIVQNRRVRLNLPYETSKLVTRQFRSQSAQTTL